MAPQIKLYDIEQARNQLRSRSEGWAATCMEALAALARERWAQAIEMHDAFPPMKRIAADRMAAALDLMVQRGAIDARSIAADARLNYGEPLTEEQALAMLGW